MKLKIAVLALAGIGAMTVAAEAQSFSFFRHGKNTSYGFSFGGSHHHHSYRNSYRSHGYGGRSYYQPSYGYYPAYGSHIHQANTQVMPAGVATTTYQHYGPVHVPARTTTYYNSYPYYQPQYYYPY